MIKDSGPNEDDEEILNVLRRAEDSFLSTREIAKPLSIGKEQTRNRLMELEEDGRVEVKAFGKSWGWKLSESEPEAEVYPQISHVSLWSHRLNDWADAFIRSGALFFVAGGISVLISLTAMIQSSPPPLFSADLYLAGGYIFLAAGAVSILLSGGTKLFARMWVQYARKRAEN